MIKITDIIELVEIKSVFNNPDNPRVVKDRKFQNLVKSIEDFPEMMAIRPIVVNAEMMVLGGNMRLAACHKLKMKKIPIIKVQHLTKEQQKEFIIKDNADIGEWDYKELANSWNPDLLKDWGLTIKIPKVDFNPEVNTDDLSTKAGTRHVICPDCKNDFKLKNHTYLKYGE